MDQNSSPIMWENAKDYFKLWRLNVHLISQAFPKMILIQQLHKYTLLGVCGLISTSQISSQQFLYPPELIF